MSNPELSKKLTRFRQRHKNREPVFHEHQGGLSVLSYEAQDRETLASALDKVAMVEFPETETIEVQGEFAARLLQLVLSQEIASMRVGEVCWSSALDRHGKMIQDLRVWRREEDLFVLLCPPRLGATLSNHLKFHEVTEGLIHTNLTHEFSRVMYFGARVAPSLGIPHHDQLAELHNIDGPQVWSIPGPDIGVPCRELLVPTDSIDTVSKELERRGATVTGTNLYDGLRIEQGLPIWGVDASIEDFPSEAGFQGSMNFSKGCYLGQEIVNRIYQVGPRAQLFGVSFTSLEPPAPGASLVINDGPVIQLTSAGWCPTHRIFGGLAIVPAPFATPGLEVTLLGHPDQVIGALCAIPFAQGD